MPLTCEEHGIARLGAFEEQTYSGTPIELNRELAACGGGTGGDLRGNLSRIFKAWIVHADGEKVGFARGQSAHDWPIRGVAAARQTEGEQNAASDQRAD